MGLAPTAKPSLAALIAAFAIALVPLLGSEADAAVLSKSVSSNLSSAAIQDGTLYWFQRDPFAFSDANDPGAVFARTLGSNRVVKAYSPPRGFWINAFNVRGGRVAVGIEPRDEQLGRSAVVELTPTPTGFNSTEIVSRTSTSDGASCGTLVELVNIDQTGSVIYEDISYVGQHGKCEIVRRTGVFRAVSRTGEVTELSTRKSGWALGSEDTDPRPLKPGPGDWMVLINLEEDFFEYEFGTFNLRSGDQHPFTEADTTASVDFAAGGQGLLGPSDDGSAYTLGTNPANPAEGANVARPRSLVWMHFCGSQILEISRRKGTRKRSPGGKWNLYIRNMTGTVVKRLPQRLRRGTMFDTCNADVAVFHRGLQKGRNRQFSVPLGG